MSPFNYKVLLFISKLAILYSISTAEGGLMPKEQEVREILKRLRKEGWVERNGKGSHVVFQKNGAAITVPTSKKEVPIGTYRNIARTAGWL